MNPIERLRQAVFALPLLAACASSGGGSIYVHPNADFGTYQRLAVLPLENLTTERFAGERVREILVIELSALGLFDVVELGEVNRVLRVQNLSLVDELGPEEIATLGEVLGVDALFFGTVIAYSERQIGSVKSPEISLSMRLIDVENGIAVWSATDAKAGVSIWTRLFGVGEKSRSEAASELVRRLLDTMY